MLLGICGPRVHHLKGKRVVDDRLINRYCKHTIRLIDLMYYDVLLYTMINISKYITFLLVALFAWSQEFGSMEQRLKVET